MVIIIAVGISLYIPFDGYRLYTQFGSALKYLVYTKEFSEGKSGKNNIENIVPFVAIGDNVIDYHDYCAGVVEIMPKEFRLLSTSRQDILIDNVFAGIIRAVSGTMKVSLIKLERPFVLDSYIADEDVKKEKLLKVAESGELSPKELYMRNCVIENRQQLMKAINEKDKVYRPCFYLLFFDSDKTAVKEVVSFAVRSRTKNNTVANAQMLLVLKWLDNEIIKNRDFNIKHGTDRKVVVVIDEAHVFIDTKYPVALDFMYQLAKRIRKYNGMQIIITQNIKDFVGSPEIARKSTAIINACQYSFIFALAPNDMDDLCKLYEKAGK